MERSKGNKQTGTAGQNGRARRESFTETIEHKLEQVAEAAARDPVEQKQAGLFALAVCVGGIYASLSVSPTLQVHHHHHTK